MIWSINEILIYINIYFGIVIGECEVVVKERKVGVYWLFVYYIVKMVSELLMFIIFFIV